jgi:zinc transport system substrate-binding protein
MTQFSGHFARLLIVFFSILTVSGSAEGKIAVFVSILPQKYFVQQIGKNFVDVQVMVQPGASPATYEPKSRQMAAIAKTDLYFSIGVPFENVWLSKIAASNPKLSIVSTDHGIQKSVMADHFDHGRNADHDKTNRNNKRQQESEKFQTNHGILDPHIWLSPPLVKIQAALR